MELLKHCGIAEGGGTLTPNGGALVAAESVGAEKEVAEILRYVRQWCATRVQIRSFYSSHLNL